jgi:antitoxin VapB
MTSITERIEMMTTARIFSNGRSQAVRLPKEFRFKTNNVAIRKIGDVVVLFPTDSAWSPLLEASGQFTDDFMSDRSQPKKHQRRKTL